MPSNAPPRLRTAPVLAVLVCHDGDQWLRTALSALRRQRLRPRHVIAVDTGSIDRTPKLLADAAAAPGPVRVPDGGDAVLDGVLTMPRGTGFGEAVRAAVDHAVARWGDPGQWVWLLHDDCAPEPDCLAALLTVAEVSPSAAVLGPLCLDWADPRLVVEAGVSTDASGHRQTGIGPTELDWSRLGGQAGTGGGDHRFEQSTEVLAVSSAGSLIRRDVWHELDGYDPALPMLRDDVDFGWRANLAGHLVLCAPVARMRHARAATRGQRRLDAVVARPGPFLRAVDRAHGLRTFLVNCAPLSFLLGLPRITALILLRALGFLLLRRLSDARAELAALRYLLGGRGKLLAGRAARRAPERVPGSAAERAAEKAAGKAADSAGRTVAAPRLRRGNVKGLFTSRLTRLRNAFRGGAAYLIRQRVRADAALGRLPEDEDAPSRWLPPGVEEDEGRRVVGPAALPAGALGRARSVPRRAAGLRRPAQAVAVSVATDAALSPLLRPSPRPRPSPGPRGARHRPDLVFVEVDRARVLRQLLLAPPLLLVLGLTVFALIANSGRLGAGLVGGRLLPVGTLGDVWREYLAAWHSVGGGTAAPAPAGLAVLGVLGTLFAPLGGPPAAVAVLLLGDAPIAALGAYLASRRIRVRRSVRAVAAAGYGLLPVATSAVAQGRLDVVVVHLLAPLAFAGILAVLRPTGGVSWLPIASATAFCVAVIGAFSPLTHLLVLAAALVGFVVVPGRRGDGRRRIAALFAVVLLPLALLLPWPAVVLLHPGVVLHGLGGYLAAQPVSVFDVLSLSPGGPGAVPAVGALVLLAALGALVLRPSRAMLPGLAVALLGAVGLGVVLAVPSVPLGGQTPEHGWTGAPLVVVGWGLVWAVLGAWRRDVPAGRRSRWLGQRASADGARACPADLFPAARGPAAAWAPLATEKIHGTRPNGSVGGWRPRLRPGLVRLATLAGVAVLAVLAVGGLVGLRGGPLRAGGGPTLVPVLTHELTTTGRSVLVLAARGEPTRLTAGRLPRFGDDDLVPTAAARARLDRLTEDLRSGVPDTAKAAVARAAVVGVAYLVLPDPESATRLRAAVGDLVADVPPTSDGRPVLRIQLAAGTAVLLSPELAQRARSGGQPPTELGARGIAPVDAGPPDLAVRVSDGPEGRLLVLAAEDEPGWQLTVGGQQVPVVRAWGHLVGVPMPTKAADVRVTMPSSLRELLLLAEAAAALFTLLTAIPARRKPDALDS
ncbi:glycosyltransferase [Solihabitans fulvus]|uniref:Glycosyltransferase n=1 Tax=Solihabitans fulvus TaxID=1892852 RepID=A0A5B2XCU2_9PSEU|nr:glycosyltransferase family 2 protein [Solihabitans fulvus]KAA2260935.1 glycosyltransferase [Solihabitans fulvus]